MVVVVVVRRVEAGQTDRRERGSTVGRVAGGVLLRLVRRVRRRGDLKLLHPVQQTERIQLLLCELRRSSVHQLRPAGGRRRWQVRHMLHRVPAGRRRRRRQVHVKAGQPRPGRLQRPPARVWLNAGGGSCGHRLLLLALLVSVGELDSQLEALVVVQRVTVERADHLLAGLGQVHPERDRGDVSGRRTD